MAAKKAGTAAKVAAGKKTAVAASTDVIFTTAQDVENLTAAKAFSMVDDLSNDIEQNSFKLGGVLSVVQRKCEEDAEEWLAGSKSFKDLCNEKFAIHHRKAYYLISIYTNLVEKEIPYSAVAGLGWSKISRIAPVITLKNVEGWVKKAKAMSFLSLEEAVKKALAKGSAATGGEGSDVTYSSMNFKLADEQKKVVKEALAKCKTETNTEYDSVALTNLATGYLGGSVNITTEGAAAPAKPLTKKQKKEAFKAMAIDLGLDDAVEMMGEAFPDANIEVTTE